MTELQMDGVARVDEGGGVDERRVFIGDRDVLAAVREAFPPVYRERKVTVAIADERYEGALNLDFGSPGYSEYTPADAADLEVGPHSLFDQIERLSGQTITLWIADEPLDLAQREADEAERKQREFEARTTLRQHRRRDALSTNAPRKRRAYGDDRRRAAREVHELGRALDGTQAG